MMTEKFRRYIFLDIDNQDVFNLVYDLTAKNIIKGINHRIISDDIEYLLKIIAKDNDIIYIDK
jgi:hypothetical protein